MKANHKEAWIQVEGSLDAIKIMPGQFVTGRFSLHKEYYPRKRKKQKSPRTLWRWLQKLENIENLTIKSYNKYSIVTIINWGTYQVCKNQNYHQNDQQVTNRCPTGDQQVTTNNNVDNANNVNKKEKYLDFVFLTKTEHEKLLKEFGIEKLKSWIERVNNYVGSKGKKYKSHYHTILAWNRNDKKKQEEVDSVIKSNKIDFGSIPGRDG